MYPKIGKLSIGNHCLWHQFVTFESESYFFQIIQPSLYIAIGNSNLAIFLAISPMVSCLNKEFESEVNSHEESQD